MALGGGGSPRAEKWISPREQPAKAQKKGKALQAEGTEGARTSRLKGPGISEEWRKGRRCEVSWPR